MRSTRVRAAGTAAAAALAATVLGIPAAAAVVDPAPIGPRQAFIGEVNGQSSNAVIKVGCFGPVSPGRTGHPIAGQSVDVTVPPVAVPTPTPVALGYTGEAADHVVVDFGSPVSTGSATVLKEWAVKAAIPTGIELPCYGTGKVAFIPLPTSSTARTAYVTVTYESIGV
jgi:hypothetical protein